MNSLVAKANRRPSPTAMSTHWTALRTYMRWPARVVVIPIVVTTCCILETIFWYGTTSGEFCVLSYAMDMKMEGFKTIWADREETGCVVLFARRRRREAPRASLSRAPPAPRRTRRGCSGRGESSCWRSR